jgi:SAM-dependent methyltransferase
MVDPTGNFDDAIYALRTGPESSVEALAARFEYLVPWYATFLRPWLPADKSSPMLDVPCGAGNLLYTLCKLGYTAVSGIDSEPLQIELARRLGLPASTGDAFAAVEALPPGSVERIFSLDFLEHVERADALRFSRLAHRALAPGGYLICRMPSADGPFGSHDRYNDLTHRWAATSNSILPFLQLAGFDAANVRIVQEAPVRYKFTNVVRRALFDLTTTVAGFFLEVVGIGAPRVWTRSMWIVARR